MAVRGMRERIQAEREHEADEQSPRPTAQRSNLMEKAHVGNRSVTAGYEIRALPVKPWALRIADSSPLLIGLVRALASRRAVRWAIIAALFRPRLFDRPTARVPTDPSLELTHSRRRVKISGDNLPPQLARGLSSIYLVSGDEPLLVNEAADAVRARARAEGFTERELHVVERGFDWQALLAESR